MKSKIILEQKDYKFDFAKIKNVESVEVKNDKFIISIDLEE